MLGRTPLIERRSGRYVVRDRMEIERLLKRAYNREPAADWLMTGLATIAAALNANDQCLARIAAVHLKIPNLADVASREAIEVEDALIKSADWNPDLHPRAGVPPNPGWFAPTGSSTEETPPTTSAPNDDLAMRSDASPSPGDADWVTLPPGKYIDELHDFLEWLANAKPEDEAPIRAEIKRYYYDVGDTIGGDALNRVLSDILEAGADTKTRQQLLNSIEAYARTDPAEVAQLRDLTVGGVLLFSGRPSAATAFDTPSDVWKLGWAARGLYISEQLGANLPANFPGIDIWLNGIATSIKSIDLGAATYQNAVRLTYRLNQYIDRLASFDGAALGTWRVESTAIESRVLNLAVPKGSISSAQRAAIEVAKSRADALGVHLIVTPF